MGIFFIVIGLLLFIFSLITFIAANSAISNEEKWEDFYKYYEESVNNSFSEEEIYNKVSQLRTFSLISILITLSIIIFGIVKFLN